MTDEMVPTTERELLLLLHQKVDTMDRRLTEKMDAHGKDDAREFGLVRVEVSAAHRRLDGFKNEFGKLLSWKDKILGGAAVLGFAFSAIVSIAAIINN